MGKSKPLALWICVSDFEKLNSENVREEAGKGILVLPVGSVEQHGPHLPLTVDIEIPVRIASGIAVIGAITGELFAGSSRVGEGGLGYSILYVASQLQTDYLFALALAATVMGFSFLFPGIFLEWYFLHRWHESARAPEAEVE